MTVVGVSPVREQALLSEVKRYGPTVNTKLTSRGTCGDADDTLIMNRYLQTLCMRFNVARLYCSVPSVNWKITAVKVPL